VRARGRRKARRSNPPITTTAVTPTPENSHCLFCEIQSSIYNFPSLVSLTLVCVQRKPKADVFVRKTLSLDDHQQCSSLVALFCFLGVPPYNVAFKDVLLPAVLICARTAPV
jgi:hypothetical protein